MHRKIGSVLVTGDRKVGVTALDRFPGRPPEQRMGYGKELHFLDSETLDWTRPDDGLLHAAAVWNGGLAMSRSDSPAHAAGAVNWSFASLA